MAMKKRAVVQKPKATNDDTVIYKVMIVLGLALIALLALQMVSRYYALAGYYLQIRTGLAIFAVVFSLAAIVCVFLFWKRRKQSAFWRTAGFPFIVSALLLAIICAVLYYKWTNYVAFLYFLIIAAAVFYMIALLFQREFTLLSFLNLCAGVVFFALSRLYGSSGSVSPKTVTLNIFLAAVCLLTAWLMFAAQKPSGSLNIRGKEIRVFTHSLSPIIVYTACIIWLLCLIASALLGSVFAYYCIFAVAALELIAAVYYTVKLS